MRISINRSYYYLSLKQYLGIYLSTQKDKKIIKIINLYGNIEKTVIQL